MAEDNASPAAAPASTPEPRSVGELLRSARSAQGLSLEQIATELRIELPQLQALESDRFDRIGVPVFVKGYLRQYGARIGLDYRDLLAQYYKQTSLQEVQIQPSKTIKLHDERQITVWVIAALAILVVIVGLAAWWLGGGGFNVGIGPSASSAERESANASLPAAAASAPATEAAAPANDPASPAAEPVSTSTSTSPPPATATPAVSTTPTATPTSAAAGTTPSARAAAARPSAASAAASAPIAASAPVAAAGGAVSLAVPLELTFDQESWAEVTDARGERLYYGLGSAGRRALLRGEPPFSVVLGNAAGVKIVVDGDDFAVPAKGRPGEYVRFSVDVATD